MPGTGAHAQVEVTDRRGLGVCAMRVVLLDVPQLLAEILADALRGQAELLVPPAAPADLESLFDPPPVDLIITGDPGLLADPQCAGVSVLGITPEGRSAMLRLPGEGYRTYNDLSPRALMAEVVVAVRRFPERDPGD
jgi:hypothetical protein